MYRWSAVYTWFLYGINYQQQVQLLPKNFRNLDLGPCIVMYCINMNLKISQIVPITEKLSNCISSSAAWECHLYPGQHRHLTPFSWTFTVFYFQCHVVYTAFFVTKYCVSLCYLNIYHCNNYILGNLIIVISTCNLQL